MKWVIYLDVFTVSSELVPGTLRLDIVCSGVVGCDGIKKKYFP